MIGICNTMINSLFSLLVENDQMIHITGSYFYKLLVIQGVCVFFNYFINAV